MEVQKFMHSWTALWLWRKTLSQELSGSCLKEAFTFRKGQIDLLFDRDGKQRRLSWQVVSGNQAKLGLTNKFSVPRKRVAVLSEFSNQSPLQNVQIQSEDRLLRFVFENQDELILGFYPGALNIYHFRQGHCRASFFKKPPAPELSDVWIEHQTQIPTEIPGSVSRSDFEAAIQGLRIDDSGQLFLGKDATTATIDIKDLERTVAQHRSINKPTDQGVSVGKHAQTVLKRWRSKLKKMRTELELAGNWPTETIRLQGLQIALAMRLPIQDNRLEVPAHISSTGDALVIKLKTSESIQQAIEAAAKKIRKAKGKLVQLDPMIRQVENNIKALETLMQKDSVEDLQQFLNSHGELLDARGRQSTERTPYKKHLSPSGFDILVGRGSQDNDALTFKVAGKNDWWFHARQIRGSHVVLRTGNRVPEPADIRKAAEYAALNSKAKHAGIVVVQYCQRKHLSKPKGSPPGSVLVHHEKSITIDLDQINT